MGRFLYWLKRKQRIKEKRCGQCCLTCHFFEQCIKDGELSLQKNMKRYHV